MKKRSATKRYQEAIHHFYNVVNEGRPFTVEAAAEWAIANGLWPAPGVRDSAEAGAAWDARFAEIVAAPVAIEIRVFEE